MSIDWMEVARFAFDVGRAVIEQVRKGNTTALESLRAVLEDADELARLDRVLDAALQAKAEAELTK